MPNLSPEIYLRNQGRLAGLRHDRQKFWPYWRDLADMYLPRRYVYLQSDQEQKIAQTMRNPRILDATGTIAARTLASGLMNGITSPSRKWFKLRIAGFEADVNSDVQIWLDEVERRLLLIMAESNFYNAMALLYLDLVIFGSASMLIYEDNESVIRCYNPALGEFYFASSHREQVDTFAREFKMTVAQMAARFGVENCTLAVQNAYGMGGAHLQHKFNVAHLIEPNDQRIGALPRSMQYREFYWQPSERHNNTILSLKGFNELPGCFTRWEVLPGQAYGGCPGMDAYGDVVQLQHETKTKGQALDKMVKPPMEADVQLKNKPTALMPNGITYTQGLLQGRVGMRPIHEVRMPIAELGQDIAQVQSRIREIFHNDLFRMIAQLDTVRSATEVDARREEKLVLLGPVLERFENEALDPAIQRIYAIAVRSGLIPPAPESIQNSPIEIQYQSILATAQQAVGTAATERFLQFTGAAAGLDPRVKYVPNYEELLRDYARDIGVPAKGVRTVDEVQQAVNAEQQREQLAQEAAVGRDIAQGAEHLANSQVGGGLSALEAITGGGA